MDNDDKEQTGKENSDPSDLDNQSGQTQPPTREEPYHKSSVKVIKQFGLKESSHEFWPNRDIPRQQDKHQHHTKHAKPVAPLERPPSSIPNLTTSWRRGNPLFEDDSWDVYPRPRKKTKHNRNQTVESEGRKKSIIRKLTEMGYDESMVERGYETISNSKRKKSEEYIINKMIGLLSEQSENHHDSNGNETQLESNGNETQLESNRHQFGDEKPKPEQTNVCINTNRPPPTTPRPSTTDRPPTTPRQQRTPRSARPHSRALRSARQQNPNGNEFNHKDKQLKQAQQTLYICLKGLPTNPGIETLCNFLESRMDEDVDKTSVLLGENGDSGVIAFINKIDFSVLEKKLRERTFEGKTLEACAVDHPQSVVISHSSDSLTKEDLYTYFNQDKNGGHVLSCDERDAVYIIRFQSYREVQKACDPTRRHIVGITRVKVTPRFECKFGEVWDYKKHVVKLPKDITVTWMDRDIETFLISEKSSFKLNDINIHLNPYFAEVCCSDGENLVIKCLLTQQTPEVRKITKSWVPDVKNAYDDLVLETLQKINIHCPSPDIWQELKKKLGETILCADMNMINILEDNENSCFILVGLKTVVQNNQKKLLELKETIEKKLERKNKIVSETKTFSSGKIYILERDHGIIEQVNKIADDLEVFTDQDNGVIYFRGTAEDVCEAKVKIFEALQEKIVIQVHDLSTLQTKLIKKVVGLIHEKFKLQNINGTVDTSSGKIEVITSTRWENRQAINIVKHFTVERVINLGFESSSVLDKPEWSCLITNIKRDHAEKVLVETSGSMTVTVVATEDIFNEVFEELTYVIDHNTIITDSIVVDCYGFFEFLEKFWIDGREELLRNLSSESVQLEMHADALEIEISGTKTGIEKAKSCLKHEIKKIKQMEYVKKGFGISKVIEEDIEMLHQKCSDHNTVLSLTDSEGVQALKDKKVMQNSGPFKLKNGTVISLIVGDIARAQADVLVCTASHNLDLSAGRATRGLLQVGGKSLQDDCKTKCPNGIKDGEFVSIKGGNLGCKEVYFGALPKWNKESKQHNHKVLFKFMKDCLTETEKSGYTSIIYLALGTGDLGYPATDVAEWMYKYGLDTDKFHDGCKIKNIGFVVHHRNKATLQAFKTEENRLNSDLQKYLKTEHRSIRCRNGTLIQLVKGELAREQADVIVCGTSKELNLSSGKSCSNILHVGGQKLQDECKKKYPEGIKEGDIATVKGCGKLKCKEVYFGALPDWKTEQSKHPKMLWRFVESCMLKAHESGYSTIVFAALGTGALGYPPDRAAHLMYDSVIKFDNSHDTRSALKSVKFVVYYKDHQTIKGYFQKETELLKSLYAGTHGKKNPKIKRNVIEGHIEKLKVDVIACNASPKLNLKRGKVTHALLTCGQSLQSECDQNYPDGIEIGELAIIGPGNLTCKDVYLGVLPKYEDDEKNSEQVLFDFIMKCLTTASNNGLQSIAFPAVGTGDYNKYPHHVVASIMFKAVAKFERQNLGSLTEVCCVVLNKDVKSLQAFRAEEDKYCSPSFMQASIHRTKSNPGFTQQSKVLRNEILLRLYSDSKENIKKAKYEIDQHVKSKTLTKVIHDELVGQLPREKRNKIMDIGKVYTAVRIEVKVRQNEVILEGIPEIVYEVNNEVHNILTTYQRELHVKKEAKFMAEGFLWHYKERNKSREKYIPYADSVSLEIERAHKKGDKKKEVCIGGKQHTVDLENHCEYPNDNKSDVVYVIRRQMLTAGGYSLPDDWEPMEESDMVLQKKLQCSSQEYKHVEKMFIDSVFNGQNQQQKKLFSKNTFTISEIFRIQNKTLYQQYEAKKNQINNQNPPGHQNEQKPVWHGTRPDVIDSIMYNGFNRSYCSTAPHNDKQLDRRPWFGDGVYFSNDASYSCQDWLANNSAVQNVFLVRVLSGISCQGYKGMRVLDERMPNICYDSAVNDVNNPTEFVIFNDTQAYPEYLIKYTP